MQVDGFWVHFIKYTGFLITFVLVTVMFFIWYERRLLGRIANRPGPNRAGPFGLLQPVADVIKIITKEDIVPAKSDRLVFWLAPIICLAPVFMIFTVIPFADGIMLVDLNIGILFVLAISSITAMGFFIAGWSSNNKYALMGAMRDMAQLISYGIPMALSIIGIIIVAGSLSLSKIVEAQTVPFVLLQPLGFVVFFIASLAEINRTPFDLIEADSEIVAGYNIEFSGAKFAILFLTEYAEALAMSAIIAILFLSGWRGPVFPPWLWFVAKIIIVFTAIVWIRGTLPRIRIDQSMAFAWKFLLPLAMTNLLLTGIQVVFYPAIPAWLIFILGILITAVLVFFWSRFFKQGEQNVRA